MLLNIGKFVAINCIPGQTGRERTCPITRLRAATPITPKFEELNRCAAIEDHRDRDAFRRRIRGCENFLSFHRGLEVVYFKRYVRDGLNQGVDWAIGLEAHPLNATSARLKRGDVHLEFFQIIFAGSWNVCRDADVVIPPTMYRSGRRLIVPLSRSIRAVRLGLCNAHDLFPPKISRRPARSDGQGR